MANPHLYKGWGAKILKTIKRRLVHLGIVAAVATTAYASAATLGGVASETLGAGSAVVQSCDGDGLALSYAVVDDAVTEVIVDDIAPTCVGGRLSVTLTDASDAAIGSGDHASLSATSQSIAIASQPDAELVTDAHVLIVGP